MSKATPKDDTLAKPKDQKDPMQKYYVKNKYDPYSLKFSLDEYITDTVQKKYPTKEIHKMSTYKILLGVLLTGLMLLSHFYPLKFPENFHLILWCCVAYYVVSGVYTYYEEKVVRDTFLEFYFPFDKTITPKTKKIRFGSKLELYSDVYKFTIESQAGMQATAVQKKEHSLYVGNYFDAKGKPDFAAIDRFVETVMAGIKSS